MSSADINLISQKGESLGKSRKLVTLRRVALSSIILVGFISLFIFFLNITTPLLQVKKEEASVLSAITSKQRSAARLSIINERVLAISKIYKERLDFSDVLNMLNSKNSSDITTSGLNIDETSVVITVNSPSLLPLNNFLNSVVDESKKNEKIKSVSLEGLSVSDTSSSYLMSIRIRLK